MQFQKSVEDAHKLLQLLELVEQSVKNVIKAWANPQVHPEEVSGIENLATWELFNAQRVLVAASGMFTELVANPSSRLLEVSSQYNESRALHIAAELRIADLVAKKPSGMPVNELSAIVGIESRKLCMLMCLGSDLFDLRLQHGFYDVFARTIFSKKFNQTSLRTTPFQQLCGFDLYSASDFLPRALLNYSQKGVSYDVNQTAFQDAVGTTKPRWEWLEEKVSPQDLQKSSAAGYPGAFGPDLEAAFTQQDSNGLIPRPEHATFGLAMLGGGRVTGTAHLYDFPWESLGDALVVDVGGGVGGFCLQLSQLYPKLKFVVQDRAPVLEQAKTTVWSKENPSALDDGLVTFISHDFFAENPVKGADVYWLRYILHDWSDDYCVKILTAVRVSMSRTSRLLICDQVMNTTFGCDQIASAPAPLPANYGCFTRWSHQRDLTMMSIINGIERTPAELKDIIERAGLVMRKIYDCRSQVSLVECVLPNAESMSNGTH